VSVDFAINDNITTRQRKLVSKKYSKLLCSFLRLLLGISNLSFYLAAS